VLVPFALAGLFAHCAPAVGPVTMSAIVAYESGARPNAIGDNTARRSYDPPSQKDAILLGAELLRRGHNIDVGYAQVNSRNFVAYGLTIESAFDPCTNVATGARILQAAYAGTARRYGPGQVALVHALSAYNSGSYWSGLGYAGAVFATARQLHYQGGQRTRPRSGRAVPFRPRPVWKSGAPS
jgi:type IV secretion system protein VirB1